jgi:asparagine synthase (glutamine-hydrolysing)
MCGIAGAYWFDPDSDRVRAAVDRMADVMRHRGPDSDGWSRSQFAEVGFRRLSIIDLATGDQPLANEDGTVECFLNGEIYNYVALRDELTSRGHVLRTSSDTEVLPHLYEELGEGMFAKLRGMFVVCVIDHRTRTMLLARDQFGVKQLYYARVPGGVVFASELKGVLASGVVRPEVDNAGLIPYLSLLYTPQPHTLVKGVMKLAPGALLRFAPDGGVEQTAYYHLPAETARADIGTEEAAHRVVDLLGESVRLQLHADVPVGISLSGGVDSSAIACLASLSRSAGGDLTAITISWPDTPAEEITHSSELCAALGIAQEILEPELGAIEDELPVLAWISDEPIADPATYSQFRVAEAASRRVKVLLGGTGGDELFGGYGHYVLPWKKAAYASLPGLLQRSLRRVAVPRWFDADSADALLGYRSSRVLWHLRYMRHLDAGAEALLSDAVGGSRPASANLERLFESHRAEDHLNQQLLVDLQSYLPEQLLPMLDRATMAASIEGRVPFVDVPLVEFCASLSGRAKLGWPQVRKRVLKRAIADAVPSRILQGQKTGMPSHFPTFMARRPELVRHVLLGPQAYAKNVLPVDWLEARLGSVEEMQRSFPVLYALVVFEVWHRLFVEEGVYDRPNMSLSELMRVPARSMTAT